LRVRFQADNDLRSAIRIGVIRREPAIDFQSAKEARLDSIPDQEVLRLAMKQGRILVSHDENSMSVHFRKFIAAGNQSPGLLLVPQGRQIGSVIETIVLIWIASQADEWSNRMAWIPF
jgi:hypothetical protein